MQTPRPSSAKDGILWFYAALRLFQRASIAFTLLGLLCLITPNVAVFVGHPFLRLIIKITLYLMSLLFFASIVVAARAVDNGQTITLSMLFAGLRQRLAWRIVLTFWLSGFLYGLIAITVVGVLHFFSHDSWSDITTSFEMVLRAPTNPVVHQDIATLRHVWTQITDAVRNYPASVHFIVQCIIGGIVAVMVSWMWVLSLPLVLFNAMTVEQAFRHSYNTTRHNFSAVGLYMLISIALSISIAIAAILCFAVTVVSSIALRQSLGGFSQLIAIGGFILFCAAYCFIQVYGYISQYVLWKQLSGPTIESAAEHTTAIAI